VLYAAPQGAVQCLTALCVACRAVAWLQTYERDGWADFPTQINPERREVRPTADRGPILLCVDTSGSMRGPRWAAGPGGGGRSTGWFWGV